MHKSILFEKRSNVSVRCTACRHYCTIPEGKSGVCGVRVNRKGELYLAVYGRAVAANIDPVEKKPLFHFLPGSQIFSFGTIGCNFACSFCQNWDISQAAREPAGGKNDAQTPHFTQLQISGKDLQPEQIVQYCIENEIPSIAYTYNEPAIFFEYVYDTAKLARKSGIRNVLVSNGYESGESLKMLASCIDAMNIDLKAFTEGFYRKMCKARLQPVLDTIKEAHERGIWIEITTLVIPSENDSKAELGNIAKFIAGVDKNIPWHISRFHPDYKMQGIAATPVQTLESAYRIGKSAGLRHVYVGNIENSHENTCCPNCGKVLISRKGYSTRIEGLEGGRCGCGESIPGIWK